jgi:hypothetical protein
MEGAMGNGTVVWLKLTLESDAAFGRGDGLAGIVNAEVQHDRYGMPFLAGKTLKGLLTAQCAEIMFALKNIPDLDLKPWKEGASFLFGSPGSRDEGARMTVDDARLPEDFRSRVMEEFRLIEHQPEEQRSLKRMARRMDYLQAFTAIRNQTAMSSKIGAPLRNSLRSTRVIVRSTPFIARLEISGNKVSDPVKSLLAACTQILRRLGSQRNRGLGKVKAELFTDPACDDSHNVTKDWVDLFEQLLPAAKEVEG